jgi:hypothetical protein
MPRLLRFSMAAILLLAFCIDTSAQRASRRRCTLPPAQPAIELSVVKITREVEQTAVNKLQEYVAELKGITASQEPVQSESVQKAYSNDYDIVPITLDQEIKFPYVILGGDIDVDKLVKSLPKEELDSPPAFVLDCRETNPINKQKIADAYPWISADGLRLYFSSSRNVSFSKIHISTRASVNDPFGEPQVLGSQVPEGFIGAAFTQDELTMCLVKKGDLYISVRKDRTAQFPSPEKLQGGEGTYHLGPSFSPDGKEIIVTTKIAGEYGIRRYVRTSTFAIEEAGDIELPEENEPGPGQLSKDGLAYYFSIKTKSKETLWRYSRPALDLPFNKLEELDGLPEWVTSLPNQLQPSVNGDGSVLLFVTSQGKSWSDDEIVLVNLAVTKKEMIAAKNTIAEKAATIVTVYPNPFTSAVTIDIAELPVGGAIVNVYDMNGRQVKQQRTNDNRTEIVLDKLAAGIYLYQVSDNTGKAISSGKLVKGN